MTAREITLIVCVGFMILPALLLSILLCQNLGFPWWIFTLAYCLVFIVFCYLTWRQKSEESEKEKA